MTTTTVQTIRILLIDDDVTVRSRLRTLLESQPRLQVVGEASDHAAALTVAAREQPDIILLDLDLNDNNDLDFLTDLAAQREARIIVLSGVDDEHMHQHLIRLGAAGLILKERAPEHLIGTIERVHAGEICFDRNLIASALAQMAQVSAGVRLNGRGALELCRRERDIIRLVCEGLQDRHIATHLGISETTVRHYLSGLFRKLNVRDRLELVVFAFRNELYHPKDNSQTDVISA